MEETVQCLRAEAPAQAIPPSLSAATFSMLALSRVMGAGGGDVPAETLDLFDQASDVCRGEPGRVAGLVGAAAVLNGSLLRQLRDEPFDAEPAVEACDALRAVHPDDALGIYIVDATAASLGLCPVPLATESLKRRILLGPRPELTSSWLSTSTTGASLGRPSRWQRA